jgi:hypothetical protein
MITTITQTLDRTPILNLIETYFSSRLDRVFHKTMTLIMNLITHTLITFSIPNLKIFIVSEFNFFKLIFSVVL